MSFLTLSGNIPNFSKAAISLWFRVPKESIDKARAAYVGNYFVEPVLNGIIPLVTFGEKPTRIDYNLSFTEYASQPVGYVTSVGPGPGDATWGGVDVPAGDFTFSEASRTLWNPSYIGVRCRRFPGEDNQTHFVVSFQTGKRADLKDHHIYAAGATSVPLESPSNPVTTFLLQPSGIEDGSFGETGVPESYDIEIEIKKVDDFADKWHHVVVSCDLSKDVSTTATESDNPADGVLSCNKMWVALDDKNYDGYDAFPYYVEGLDNKDKNSTLTRVTSLPVGGEPRTYSEYTLFYVQQQYPEEALFWAGTYTNATGYSIDAGTFTSRAELESTAIQLSPVGVPASDECVDSILRVELAEFQLFAGVTLDTSKAENRRAFVDGKGMPVPPDQKKQTDEHGKTVKESGSIEMLMKEPEILLHKSSNWKKGTNTGSGGDLVPTAKIITYTPDPSLHGDQGKQGKPKTP